MSNNLRTVTKQQNQQNKRKWKVRTTSNFKGVYWNKHEEKWQAQIQTNGKRKMIGRFVSEIEAARAYNTAAQEAFGEFALVNRFDEARAAVAALS